MKLSYSNALLCVFTFGLYLPWAKTHRRIFICQNIFFKNTPLQYTGKGEDLFWKWGKALCVFVPFWILMGFLAQAVTSKAAFLLIHNLLLILSFVLFAGLIKFGGLKYLISQTRFFDKSIHLKFDLRSVLVQYVAGFLISLVTLGLYYPFFYLNLRKILINKIISDNHTCSFHGSSKNYFLICAKGFFLILITLGFYYPWHQKNRWQFLLQNTHWDRSQILLVMNQKQIFYYALMRWPVMVFSLGILSPLVTHYWMKLFLQSLVYTSLAPTDRNH
jgi:uncharacterized membrane protein YjgN (DUF898 family)